MPTLLTIQTFRLAFLFSENKESWGADGCNQNRLHFPSGVSLRFQIGVYENIETGEFYDMSQISNLRAEVKKMRSGYNRPLAEDPTYMQSPAVSPDASTITSSGWADGTEQHATFDFEASETALDPGGYWLVFSGFTNGGKFDSFGWGRIDVVQDGTGVASPVQPLDPSYYTASQIDDWRQSTGLSPTFNYYLKHFESIPEPQTFSGNGSVIAFVLGGITRYLHVPDPYDPTQEAFYANFSDPNLSNLIVRRSMT